MERYYTYCKFSNEKRYSAFDINEGYLVSNLIYCTLVENTLENQIKLQELADLNKDNGLSIQLRDTNGKVVFQTK